MFAGFYAIVAAIDLKFERAGAAVFIAMIFDGLDGRVARWTHTESAFGKEYDSLSDMVSFGVAPAIVTYQWGVARIAEYGPLWRRLGWLVCFFYAAAAALRLARFNSRTASQDKHYFEGLPSPSAAAIVAALVWLASDQTNIGLPGLILAFLVTASAGALMISRFAFNSFKQVNPSARVRFTYIVLVPLAFIFIFLHLPISLLACSVAMPCPRRRYGCTANCAGAARLGRTHESGAAPRVSRRPRSAGLGSRSGAQRPMARPPERVLSLHGESRGGGRVAARAREAGVDWPELRARVAACTRCTLCKTRTQTVFGVGNRRRNGSSSARRPARRRTARASPSWVGRASC